MKTAKRVWMRIVLLLGIVILLAFCAHILLANYYDGKFFPNTWINGVYCTGKTVDEVNAELLSKIKAPIVLVTDNDDVNWMFSMSDMGYQADFSKELNEVIDRQNVTFWFNMLHNSSEMELLPLITYDIELLKADYYDLDFIKDTRKRKLSYEIFYSEANGFQLYDGLCDRLHVENTFENLTTWLDTMLPDNGDIITIPLNECKSFYEYELSEAQKEIYGLWEKLKEYYTCDIVYDMGTEEVILSESILARFLMSENGLPALDPDGNFIIDRNAVENFVDSLADRYDTYKKEREFLSTRGDIVTVKGKTYGTLIDRKAEVDYLMDHLLKEAWHTGIPRNHIPEYEKTAYVRGLDDIGNTYIEVDLKEQKLYYYQKGILELSSDIVSGNQSSGRSTPEGVCYVYAKQTDRILRGRGYASHVDYWMPVNSGIGIHDADWRDEFGGNIYKNNGSHGCINLPPKIVPELFEMVEIGTPVIIFK